MCLAGNNVPLCSLLQHQICGSQIFEGSHHRAVQSSHRSSFCLWIVLTGCDNCYYCVFARIAPVGISAGNTHILKWGCARINWSLVHGPNEGSSCLELKFRHELYFFLLHNYKLKAWTSLFSFPAYYLFIFIC